MKLQTKFLVQWKVSFQIPESEIFLEQEKALDLVQTLRLLRWCYDIEPKITVIKELENGEWGKPQPLTMERRHGIRAI